MKEKLVLLIQARKSKSIEKDLFVWFASNCDNISFWALYFNNKDLTSFDFFTPRMEIEYKAFINDIFTAYYNKTYNLIGEYSKRDMSEEDSMRTCFYCAASVTIIMAIGSLHYIVSNWL